jgi:hypothetical protein
MMACDDYSVGTDSVEALDFAGWPDQDLYLSKEYAEELEKAARQAGGRGKERGFYEFTSEAFTDGDKGQWMLSYRVDEVQRDWHSISYQPVAFLSTELVKFCRVRRHEKIPAWENGPDSHVVLDMKIGDPVLFRIGTFVGFIKQLDRDVCAEKQGQEGLW